MIELGGKPGELAITLEIKRAATGETETVNLIGTITKEESSWPSPIASPHETQLPTQ